MSEDQARYQLLQEIFHEMLALPEGQRAQVLTARCGADLSLLTECVSLLNASQAEERLGSRCAAESRNDTNPGTRRSPLGPYQLDRLLGRGGMGAVYLAHRIDGQFDQQVAIKLIDLPLATDLFRERFRLERQILAGLVHPFIARLLDGGVTEAGELYLAMEYVDGVPITRYANDNHLDLRQRVQLFAKVCGAVQYAHQNLVVHRDLKPDNIFVVADGTPRLLDFGTAKLLVATPVDSAVGFTQHGLHSFTPQYASPEQVLGEPVTTATDTYSLGVLLFVLLTGVPPYTMKEFTTAEMLRVICSEPPPSPGSVPPAAACKKFRIDADLDSIVLKALRKEPTQRYVTVEQFSADIEAWLLGLPVAARRANWRYRAHKFARRNKIALLAAGLLTASVVAGVGGVLWQSRLANATRQRAEARSQDLRELSNSLLSEIDEAIKELPGSTPVQRLLVTRVLDHLDRMANDSIGDDQTQKDLIEAYTRLGNLQGNPYDQNIGDPAGAGVSLEKAIRIGRARVAASPQDTGMVAALAAAEQSDAEVLFGMGRTREAITLMESAVSTYERRLAVAGASASDFAQAASAVGTLGDFQGQSGVASLGDPAAALQAYRQSMQFHERALAVDPAFVRSRRGVAIAHVKIGNILVATDPWQALEEYRASLAAWLALPEAEQSNSATRRGIAHTYFKIANALADAENYPQSIAEYEKAAVTFELQASGDPDDSRANYDLAVLYNAEALTYIDMLTPPGGASAEEQHTNAQQAIQLFRRASAILQRLITVNPTNRSWAATLAYERTWEGWLEQTYGLKAEGPQQTSASIAALIKAAGEPDATVDVLDMATSARLVVLPKRLRDPAWTAQYAERLVTITRRKKPAFFLTLARALRANGQSEQARQAASEGLALLPVLAPGSAMPRLNRLLHSELSAHAESP